MPQNFRKYTSGNGEAVYRNEARLSNELRIKTSANAVTNRAKGETVHVVKTNIVALDIIIPEGTICTSGCPTPFPASVRVQVSAPKGYVIKDLRAAVNKALDDAILKDGSLNSFLADAPLITVA